MSQGELGQDELARALAERRRKVISYQIIIGLGVAAVFYGLQGVWGAKSALYGAAVNLFMTYLLGRGVARAGHVALQSARSGMVILFIGVVQRFIFVLVLFGVGFAVLKLDPLAAIVGFGLVQLGYLISLRRSTN